MQEERFLLKKHKIAIDLMGADRSPEYIYEAVKCLSIDSTFVFFGTEEFAVTGDEFIVCPEVITMQDDPVKAVCQKSDSSLLTALSALKEGSVDALLSCANTGALVAGARMTLDLLPGITRPPLACFIPTERGHVLLLDVGASPDASEELLWQYATLGTSFIGIKRPKVALLNIGSEATKGTSIQKKALKLIQERATDFDFVGNKEPYDIFTHSADVFVTNGLMGNLFLKSCEAMARFFSIDLQDSGAHLLGLNKPVMKCHGHASKTAIAHALQQLSTLLRN